MKLRKLRLFGLSKTGLEILWASLVFNVTILIRVLRKEIPAQPVAA
jgi:hypothetical protein